MRTAILIGALLAATPAFADPQIADVQPQSAPTWRAVFYSSLVLGATSAAMLFYGRAEIANAGVGLCASGAYPSTPGCSRTAVSPATVAAYDAEGNRGHVLTVLGATAGLAAGAVAVASLYEGFIKREPRVMVVPVATPSSCGASLSLRF